MLRAFWSFIARLSLVFLSLRYRIKSVGFEKLDQPELRKGGILFLPNHPAHMDPLFLSLLFWPRFRMRPLAIEYIYRMPILKPLMKLLKAIPVPNFDTSVNQLKVRKAQEGIRQIVEGLKRGENFILYPGGRLKSSGKEVLGGSSAAQALIQEYPEAHVVLVRTTGLWGSSFSRALLGHSPDLPKTLGHGIKVLLKNLMFFCPRRDVTIEVEIDPPDFPRNKNRLEFNRYLEQWYNRYLDEKGKIVQEEPLKLVSYSFWHKDFPEVFQPKQKKLGKEVAISDETRKKIYGEIRKIIDNPGIKVSPEMNLAIDLGMDSLNIAEMIAYLSQNYDIGEIHPEEIDTVQRLLEIAEGAVSSDVAPHELGHARWPEEKGRPDPTLPVGKTLPEALLHSCERMAPFLACGDDVVGVMHYRRLRKAILVLACHFQRIPDTHVAIMLPASIGAFIIASALQCAGKVPVMLNWTLGPRYLEEMMKLSGAKKILSSWKFLDRLPYVDFGNLIDQIELLEDIRQTIGLTTKLKGVFLSFCSVSSILRFFRVHKRSEDDPAVVLFTSGTEASPKGVPLSHKNILSNLRSAMQCIEVHSNDALYGILPPFHSFGFSVAGFFPLLAGLKIAFYPDPTDRFALAEGIERWQITIFCAPPSFLKGLFQTAKREQLTTVRYFVVGAEKAPPELYERVQALGTGARLVEGYGITECAPVVTLTRPNLPPKGVGTPLPDVELCTIHPESGEPLPEGAEGEICVFGPNVFRGYLGHPRDAFVEIRGKRWYKTGDLGFVDKEGVLQISGRLKRFTKISGEMISLGAIEEVLVQELLRRGALSPDICALAVCVEEKELGKPQFILFTTISLEKEEANEILKNSGMSRLVKISSVRRIEEIPLMGTGKTDYRKLQAMLQ